MATYLIRVNLDIKSTEDKGKSVRFLTAVESIKSFMSNEDKIVILSHRGRPEGREDELSLRPFKELFERALGRSVTFLDNIQLQKAESEIKEAPPGSIFLMENLRFLIGETENNPELAKQLASLGDVFINDDFATAHRENASNVGVTKFIESKMGPILEKEISELSKLRNNPEKPFVLVIGGAKMADKIEVIQSLIDTVDTVLVGGGAANTLLKAKGIDIGSSIYESEMMDVARELINNPKIILPRDYAKEGDRILDIGPETAKEYSKIIKEAKTVVWGGPMGYFEDPRFAHGSLKIAGAIAEADAFSVVGGGETTEIIRVLKLEDKVDHISTGGGAMLDFLSQKEMPAIEALIK